MHSMHRRSGIACLCVCVLVTTASPAKTTEPIEMPFVEDAADTRGFGSKDR